ncbi:DUF4037 domain-containing protein [Krasilnikoviella flava]|uniref:DUF4037 domain-containing protein n=1 Tax=Krasilnikoviella flava TaxID=526729 RepID=UPI0009A6A783|nr:DUF4037 domain-containing protein [Krasilnikoviella flava]
MTTGIGLARAYYDDVVRPLLEAWRPGLPHAAARLGSGSDVLGLDDETSRDHDWGLRLTLLVDEPDVATVDAQLEATLPAEHRGLPTRFATTWEPVVRHRVEVATPRGFARSRLGLDPVTDLDAAGWLSLTGQSVLEVTAGAVFHDGPGELTAIRETLRWYPHDLWLHVLAAEWARVGQELPFVGRTGVRGDDAGSRVLTARLAGSLLRLGLLLERRWPPYPKWLGTAFAGTPSAAAAGPHLDRALAAGTWQERDAALGDACDALHERQRDVGLPALDGPATEPFFGRPSRGLRGLPEVLRDAAGDAVRGLPAAVEQWVDAVDVLMDGRRRVALTRAAVGEAPSVEPVETPEVVSTGSTDEAPGQASARACSSSKLPVTRKVMRRATETPWSPNRS